MLYKPEPITVDPSEPFRNDRLEREIVATNLSGLVRSIDKPFVFAIDAPWGGGKTTFVKMWRAALQGDGHRTIYFNAWESDFSQEPLLSFMAAFDEQLPDAGVQDAKKRIVQLGAGILRRAVPYAVQLGTAGVLGAQQVESAFKFSDKTKQEIENWAAELASEQMAAFKAEQDAVSDFRDALTKISQAGPGRKPLVVFVDELDRCRPDFAIALLERVKHLFDIPGMVFVLSVDRDQLAHSVRALYGQGIDARGYLRRFIDMEFRLPKPDLAPFVETLLTRDQLGEELRGQHLSQFLKGFIALSEAMELPLREVEQTFARVSLTIRMMPNYPRENLLELITVLHLLRLRDRQVVDSFLAGTTGAVELIRSFEEMAATVRESRFGLWVEAQARWASLKEGELDEWVRSMDQRIEQGDSKLEDDEREVREMLKHVRKGTILYSGGSPLPSVRRTFQLTSQFAFPTMTDDADSSEEGSAAS